MPQDDKLPIDRKEISSFWLYRYLPIFFVDSHVFLARPAWRVFNTFRVVLANLRALSQLIYIVYFESLFDFLSKIFLFFFKSFFFVFSFFFLLFLKNCGGSGT